MVVPVVGAAILGGINAGLNVLGAFQQHAAEQQDWLNQRAQQDANTQFAQWQAGFNQRLTDANQQHSYWQATLAHNQQLAYVNSLRNFELSRAIAQAEVVGQTRAAAGADFALQSQALSQQLVETSMADAVAYQQYQVAALKARSTVAASGQEGSSIDRLINDYARQQGDFAAIQQINEGLRSRQFSRAQTAQVTQYLSQYNSQQFYEQQPYLEPMAPFQPLPTLLMPAAPTFTGTGPSGSALALNVLSGIYGGANTGLSTFGTLSNIAAGGG
jgi:hypothetical protein